MSRIAALDLGSNSFHLLVADELHGGRLRRKATRKLTLRLAEPVARDGQLGPEARERAVKAFGELVDEARDQGAERIVAVATQALRDAGDSEALRQKLHADHGIPVKVLTGLQEGYLSLRGMAGALRLPAGEELLGLDLGGGSYEVAYGGTQGGEGGAGAPDRFGPLVAGATLPLGAARVRHRLRHDPPRLVDVAALHNEALSALGPVAAEVRERRAGVRESVRAAATAGTIRDLGRVGLALGTGNAPDKVRGVVVTREQLERAHAWLCSVPTAERMELPGVSEKRADLLPAGGAVLLATMEAFGLEHLELCDWGLREGALLDALSDGEVVTQDRFTDL